MNIRRIWEALGIKLISDLIFPPKPDVGKCQKCGEFAQLNEVSIYSYFHEKSHYLYMCSSCKDKQGGE